MEGLDDPFSKENRESRARIVIGRWLFDHEKNGWGGRIRRLPRMLKKPLKPLVSSVPNDLARFLSKPQEAILSILILQSVLKR
jgi:hypothetical protein